MAILLADVLTACDMRMREKLCLKENSKSSYWSVKSLECMILGCMEYRAVLESSRTKSLLFPPIRWVKEHCGWGEACLQRTGV